MSATEQSPSFLKPVDQTITEESFEIVYKTYSAKIYRLCYYHLKNAEDAKEIVQEIFRSVWERRETLEINTSLQAYLMQAAKLQVLKKIRDKIRQERHQEHLTKDFNEQDDVTEKTISFHFLNNSVNSLVDKLSGQCRNVYKMSREQGMTNRQIAAALLISEKTVEYHMSNALSFLRRNLAQYI